MGEVQIRLFVLTLFCGVFLGVTGDDAFAASKQSPKCTDELAFLAFKGRTTSENAADYIEDRRAKLEATIGPRSDTYRNGTGARIITEFVTAKPIAEIAKLLEGDLLFRVLSHYFGNTRVSNEGLFDRFVSGELTKDFETTCATLFAQGSAVATDTNAEVKRVAVSPEFLRLMFEGTQRLSVLAEAVWAIAALEVLKGESKNTPRLRNVFDQLEKLKTHLRAGLRAKNRARFDEIIQSMVREYLDKGRISSGLLTGAFEQRYQEYLGATDPAQLVLLLPYLHSALEVSREVARQARLKGVPLTNDDRSIIILKAKFEAVFKGIVQDVLKQRKDMAGVLKYRGAPFFEAQFILNFILFQKQIQQLYQDMQTVALRSMAWIDNLQASSDGQTAEQKREILASHFIYNFYIAFRAYVATVRALIEDGDRAALKAVLDLRKFPLPRDLLFSDRIEDEEMRRILEEYLLGE
jgi:hypothetical protein